MKKIFGFLIFFMIFVFSFGLLQVPKTLAADYDIYVDKDNDGSQEGSEDKPYKTITKALEKAKEADKIYIEKGVYNEDLVINKELKIFGDDQEDTIIDGVIKIEKNLEVQNLTVKGNIVIKNGIDVILNSLIIKESPKVAIEALGGNGKVAVKNSIIKKAGTKGFYIERDRDIIITNCQIYGNKEEGIDLRYNVDGVISGNNIYENGESGLEFVVAKSDLEIKNNVFKNNGSSGIASQFYKEFKEEGNITILGNTVSGNRKYGLDCNNPQGGNPESDYFKKSVKVDKNNFSGNNDGEISKVCSIEQPAQENLEEKQNEERQKKIEAAEKEKELQEQIAEQNRQKTIQENEYKLNKLIKSKKDLIDTVLVEQDKIQKRKGLGAFLIGPNYKAINNIKTIAPSFGEHMKQFEDLKRELIETENIKKAQAEIDDILSYTQELNELIVEKDSNFSLFGWIFRILNSK